MCVGGWYIIFFVGYERAVGRLEGRDVLFVIGGYVCINKGRAEVKTHKW